MLGREMAACSGVSQNLGIHGLTVGIVALGVGARILVFQWLTGFGSGRFPFVTPIGSLRRGTYHRRR